MNQVKKQLEILLINYFRKSYSEFPKGRIVPSESPDFVVTLKNRHHLGIELTRLNPGNAAAPDSQRLMTIQAREDFIRQVQNLVEKDISQRLFVKFLFSENAAIEPEYELIKAAQTAKIIRDHVSLKSPKSFFTQHISSDALPKGLDEILVVNHEKLETSIWERSNNLGISDDVIDDIRVSILKKDKKLKFYQKKRLNYYWLIIITDRLRGSKGFNLHNKIQNHKFLSQFQHVYLFDLIKANVTELI